jgi:hypothetical protein
VCIVVEDEVDDVGEAPDAALSTPTPFSDLGEDDPDAKGVRWGHRRSFGAPHEFGHFGDESGAAGVVERSVGRSELDAVVGRPDGDEAAVTESADPRTTTIYVRRCHEPAISGAPTDSPPPG